MNEHSGMSEIDKMRLDICTRYTLSSLALEHIMTTMALSFGMHSFERIVFLIGSVHVYSETSAGLITDAKKLYSFRDIGLQPHDPCLCEYCQDGREQPIVGALKCDGCGAYTFTLDANSTLSFADLEVGDLFYIVGEDLIENEWPLYQKLHKLADGIGYKFTQLQPDGAVMGADFHTNRSRLYVKPAAPISQTIQRPFSIAESKRANRLGHDNSNYFGLDEQNKMRLLRFKPIIVVRLSMGRVGYHLRANEQARIRTYEKLRALAISTAFTGYPFID